MRVALYLHGRLPVLGTRRGALPEIVTQDVGALGDTLDDLVRLRYTIMSREPQVCRAHAERWFSHRVMAQEYIRMYKQFLDTRTLPPGRTID